MTLFIAASATAQEAEQQNDFAPAGPVSLFSTGATAQSNRVHWSCVASQPDGSDRALILRLGLDGSSVVGSRRGNWRADEGSVVLDFADARTTLEVEAVDPPETDRRRLSARTAVGEPVICHWVDSEREDGALFDDGASSPLRAAMTGEADGSVEAAWSCSVGDTTDSFGRQVSFRVNGSGTLDGAPMRWFISDYGHLMMSGSDGMTVFDRIAVDGEPSRELLVASNEGRPVRCERG